MLRHALQYSSRDLNQDFIPFAENQNKGKTSAGKRQEVDEPVSARSLEAASCKESRAIASN